MKIDFSQTLKNIEGDNLLRTRHDRNLNKSIELPATLQWAAVEALLAVQQDEKLTGEEKAKRYELALKIQAASEPLDLPVEDVALLKKLCDANFATLIVGQVRRMLDAKG